MREDKHLPLRYLLPPRSRIKRDHGEGVEWNILLEMHASPEMPKDGLIPQASSGWSSNRSVEILNFASLHIVATRWLTHCWEWQAWSTILTRISMCASIDLMRCKVSAIASSIENSTFACSVATLAARSVAELLVGCACCFDCHR